MNKNIRIMVFVILVIKGAIAEEPVDRIQEVASPISSKDWASITYMAGVNNLAPFARKNLQEQTKHTLPYMHRFVHLDTTIGNKKITKRYIVNENTLTIKNNNNLSRQAMDSGNPDTVIDCFKDALENLKAEFYMFVFWNHGSGPIDPERRPRTINSSELFIYNPATHLLDLDRSISFLNYMEMKYEQERGICFDDVTGHYLTNQGLEYAVKTMCQSYLHRKFNIIAFDACLMSTLEIADIIKDYANIMIASQEVVLGTGWRYDLVFEPFSKTALNEYDFATHIVKTYERVYSHITNDYTLAAIDLKKIPLLEKAIDQISLLLIECLKNEIDNSVTYALRASRHKYFCTHFDELSYLDCYDLLTNILSNLKKFKINSSQKKAIISSLKKLIIKTRELIVETVFANTTGKNLKQARGISIYFPERRIHPSYRKTNFYKSNNWSTFLNYYLQKSNMLEK